MSLYQLDRWKESYFSLVTPILAFPRQAGIQGFLRDRQRWSLLTGLTPFLHCEAWSSRSRKTSILQHRTLTATALLMPYKPHVFADNPMDRGDQQRRDEELVEGARG